MTQHYSKISNILKLSRKIYNTSNYKSSFTTKYLVNNYNNSYYTPQDTVLKNRKTIDIHGYTFNDIDIDIDIDNPNKIPKRM